MLDTCRITRATRPTFDPETHETAKADPATVYEGKCKVQLVSVTEQTAQTGGSLVELFAERVDVPTSVIDVQVDDDVEILTSVLDARLPGSHARVKVIPAKSYATARRLGCVGISR